MPFTVQRLHSNGLDISEIKSTTGLSRIQILPSYGALWHGWIIGDGKGEINLINHYQNKNLIDEDLSVSYRGAKLSPFACRIPDGKYSFQGKEYEFAKKFSDGSAIHGLMYNQPFVQKEMHQDIDKASVSFYAAYSKNDPGYPFDYGCTITYILQNDNRVTVETRIKNTGKETMPLVDGWHPYFTTGSKVDTCYLMFSADQIVEFDKKLIPTGRLLPYNTFLKDRAIGEIDLDNSFILNKRLPQPKCTFTDKQKKIKLSVFPSESYPVIQLYIPPDRQSIAIESLSGAPDAFNNGIGLILLKPHEEQFFSVSYQAEVR